MRRFGESLHSRTDSREQEVQSFRHSRSGLAGATETKRCNTDGDGPRSLTWDLGMQKIRDAGVYRPSIPRLKVRSQLSDGSTQEAFAKFIVFFEKVGSPVI